MTNETEATALTVLRKLIDNPHPNGGARVVSGAGGRHLFYVYAEAMLEPTEADLVRNLLV